MPAIRLISGLELAATCRAARALLHGLRMRCCGWFSGAVSVAQLGSLRELYTFGHGRIHKGSFRVPRTPHKFGQGSAGVHVRARWSCPSP